MSEEQQIAPNETGYDASDPKQVNNARKKAKRIKYNKQEVIKALMGLAEGRIWVNDFLNQTYVHGNPVVQGDPYLTHFNLGQQNVGKILLADVIEACPDEYIRMLQEAKLDNVDR